MAENNFMIKLANAAPIFERGLPRSLDVDDGILELKCKITGSPKPTVQWLKDGKPLTPNETCKIEHLPDGLVRLSISDMTPHESGTYTLVAENPNGKTEGNSIVNVLGKCARAGKFYNFFSSVNFFFFSRSNFKYLF